MDEPTYRSPEPYIREGRELMNSLDGHRQQIALDLGDEHPLFELVDRALRSADIDRLRVARAAVLGWRDAEDAVGIESARALPAKRASVRARICGGSA